MRSRGFSLLEVLVALTLIGVGFSAIFAGMSGSLRSLERADATNRRIELARSKLAEIDLVPRVKPNDAANGVFADGTRWTIRTVPYIAPVEDSARPNPASVIRVDLTLEWVGRNGIQRRTIQTYRYMPADTRPIRSLEEQLRDLE